jgi:hypothetical protein
MKIKGTRVLNDLIKSENRFVLSVGSSRSSKTYSMLQWILLECIKRNNQGIYISVVRASFPSLRRTVYREFVDLLKELGIYKESRHNKTEHVIELFGNYVEFFSLSDSQKVRGAKRNHLYLNECNEIDWESAQQLFLRTTERVLMDQNPSNIWHWSYKMKDNKDVDYIHCFPGHMNVLTINGYRRIDTISVGDLVMTRKGYKKVTRVYKNGLSDVVDYKIGHKIIQCTPGHKFWTEEYGFKEICLLPSKTTFSLYDDINDIWSNQKLNMMELSSQNITNKNTLWHVVKLLETGLCDYIDINGLEKEEKYLRECSYTTSMGINSTTKSKIYNSSHIRNIEDYIQHLNMSGIELNGLDQILEDNLCQIGLENQMKKLQGIQSVSVVKPSYKQSYTQIRNGVQRDVVQEIQCEDKEVNNQIDYVNSVNQNSPQLDLKSNIAQKNVKVPVYDLEVEDEHEYIVEGILVSNSTYKDNPFLSPATIKQIESYKEVDENFYRVYALGLPGYSTTTIYTNWTEFKKSDLLIEEQPIYDTFVYGLDVAYSSIMALIKVYIKDDTIWWEEVIYRSGLTTSDLIRMMNDMNIEKTIDIWCDAASPHLIEDLKRAGFNAKSSIKDVKAGIDLVKSKKLYIDENSTNLVNEIRRYQWKSKDTEIIYEPVKVNDHLMDAGRYATYNYYRTTLRFEENYIDVEWI